MDLQKFDSNLELDLYTQVYESNLPKPSKDSYNFYRTYASEAKGPILEPMCGAGRYLLPLLEEGFSVEGFDASEGMLGALMLKAQKLKLQPTVWQDFLQHFEAPQKYKLIYIPYGSFNLIIDPPSVKAALATIYENLMPGGIFLFEIETLTAIPRTFDSWVNKKEHPREDGKIISAKFFHFKPVSNVYFTICRFELADDKNMLTQAKSFDARASVEDVIHGSLKYAANEVVALLEEAGFHKITMMKPFDKNQKPDINDPIIVYECIK
jgi:SAM-dependent methyltransferase